MRRPIALLAAALLTAGLTPTAAPANAATSSATVTYRAQVLALTNAARSHARTCGSQRFAAAPALRANTKLAGVAGAYAKRMATEDFFSHTAPDGSTMTSRLRAAGFGNGWTGENIAAGYRTPAQVVAGWVKSPGHCENLMNPHFRVLGVGKATVSSSQYGVYWVQDFSS